MNRNVLLLNSSEEVLRIINWKHAVKLLEGGKAKKPFGYNKNYDIKTSSGVYKLPAAIVLVRYVQIPWRDTQISPTRKNIFRRDDWTCQYCEYKSKDPKKLTVDHVHPKCLGGGYQWTNLVTACPACNVKKANNPLKKSGMKLLSKPKRPTVYGLELVGIYENGKELWKRWLDIHIR
jgi:hypothetical protein